MHIAVQKIADPWAEGQQSLQATGVTVAEASLSALWQLLALALVARVVWRLCRRSQPSQPKEETGPPLDPETTPLEDELSVADCSAEYIASFEEEDVLGCPICGARYLRSSDTCEDCGVELVEEEELPDALPRRKDEGIVRVARIVDPVKSQLIAGMLRAQGMPTLLSRSSVLDIWGTDLYVFESDALIAKRLIRQMLAEMEVHVP